jgi:hypothetical protein
MREIVCINLYYRRRRYLKSHLHFKGLDLNLFAPLDVLLHEKNTTSAGERLCLTQSTVSDALARPAKLAAA